MKITPSQLQHYQKEGYLFIPNYFTEQEVHAMKQETSVLVERDLPGMVCEKNTGLVRALQGCHLFSRTFERLTRLPKMLLPVQQMISGEVYVYQFKINFKMAFGGDVWKWHQDFIYWQEEDGMTAPACANVLIFLDDVNEFNGPLLIIPRSHQKGVIDVAALSNGKGDWRENFSADLKYSLGKETVAGLVNESEIVAPKGPKGSVLFFHPNIVHGSAPNISPFDRTVLIVTYNHVGNVPVSKGEPRPEFIVSRNCEPLAPIPDNDAATLFRPMAKPIFGEMKIWKPAAGIAGKPAVAGDEPVSPEASLLSKSSRKLANSFPNACFATVPYGLQRTPLYVGSQHCNRKNSGSCIYASPLVYKFLANSCSGLPNSAGTDISTMLLLPA